MLQRDVAPQDRRFEQWMGGISKKVDALHRRSSADVDENGEIRLGDAILRFDTQSDGSVEVTMRNANTGGAPVKLAFLE